MSFHTAPATRGNDRLGQEWTRAFLFLPTVLCVCGEEAVPPTAGCLGRLGLGRAFCSACRKGWPPPGKTFHHLTSSPALAQSFPHAWLITKKAASGLVFQSLSV